MPYMPINRGGLGGQLIGIYHAWSVWETVSIQLLTEFISDPEDSLPRSWRARECAPLFARAALLRPSFTADLLPDGFLLPIRHTLRAFADEAMFLAQLHEGRAETHFLVNVAPGWKPMGAWEKR